MIDARCFENMLSEYGYELWVGDAAEIRAAMVRKQKTDTRDALQILELLVMDRFPRIWIPSWAQRDVRQMLRHRHKLVGFRTSARNQLHALVIGQASNPFAKRSLARQLRDFLGLHSATRTAHQVQLARLRMARIAISLAA